VEHFEIEKFSQNKIVLNALRYNPAILSTATHQAALKTANVIHKVKAKIQQVQNNRLLIELLKGEQNFDFIKESVSLDPVIKNPD
jgi:hypothetical protein